MKIALISLNQIWEDKKVNLNRCKDIVKICKNYNTELIIFPEMTLTGFTNNIKFGEDRENSKSINEFQKLARKYGIAIIFGIILKENNKAKNCAIFINKEGEVVDIYTKIHPFSFANEDKYFIAGDKIVKIEFENIKIGLSICYDLRFCNMYSLMDDCDIIVNIANWPRKRIEHWNILLQARAVENQTYMMGVNRIGIDGNNLKYIESSKVFNANGNELRFEQISTEVKIYDIDLKWNRKFRESFNTVRDKKILTTYGDKYETIAN